MATTAKKSKTASKTAASKKTSKKTTSKTTAKKTVAKKSTGDVATTKKTKAASKTPKSATTKSVAGKSVAEKTTAAAKRKRAKAPEVPRAKLYWGVFNQNLKRVAIYDFADRKDAEKHMKQLSKNGTEHFIQRIKEALD